MRLTIRAVSSLVLGFTGIIVLGAGLNRLWRRLVRVGWPGRHRPAVPGAPGFKGVFESTTLYTGAPLLYACDTP